MCNTCVSLKNYLCTKWKHSDILHIKYVVVLHYVLQVLYYQMHVYIFKLSMGKVLPNDSLNIQRKLAIIHLSNETFLSSIKIRNIFYVYTFSPVKLYNSE